MRIKILSCFNSNHWYYDHIGETFEIDFDVIACGYIVFTGLSANDKGYVPAYACEKVEDEL